MSISNIHQAIAQWSQHFSGRFTLYAEHLQTHEVVAHEPTRLMETASVIKLPIMIAAMDQVEAGHLDLATPLVYTRDDYVEGSGVVQNLTPGFALSLHDALTLMITVSDNVATNMVLRQIGLETVNAVMHRLGTPHIHLYKRIDFAQPGPIGLAPAEEIGVLLKSLYHRTLISPWASGIMWDILTRQQYNTIMTRELPYHLLNEENDTPALVQIGSKSGSLEGIRNDVGIVTSKWGDYTVAIFSAECEDLRFHVDNEAMRLLPRLTRLLFDHFLGHYLP
ncbi:hypothetical protein BXT84_02725 [Sulfobacillus thermotolerans]|uniref:Beta-lactamase class A catalytic domain-containing protein n=1 Tax=Sulfobacillus thermotolerans TaxID=338644 RepID=A0ABM6RNV4_9FIRM|nr:hypothetical protein BXT84_02725 [Sulfobacillus thermotolerans]